MSDLLQRLRSEPQNQDLWGAFFRSCYPVVYYLLFHLSQGDAESAEDLTQETLLRFFKTRAYERVPDEGSAHAYLRVTARNLFRDHRRKLAAEKRDATQVPLHDAENHLSSERARQDLLTAELGQDLRVLAKGLREDERELLRLAIEGCSLQEIARHFDISYSAAAVRLHRLRAKLSSL